MAFSVTSMSRRMFVPAKMDKIHEICTKVGNEIGAVFDSVPEFGVLTVGCGRSVKNMKEGSSALAEFFSTTSILVSIIPNTAEKGCFLEITCSAKGRIAVVMGEDRKFLGKFVTTFMSFWQEEKAANTTQE